MPVCSVRRPALSLCVLVAAALTLTIAQSARCFPVDPDKPSTQYVDIAPLPGSGIAIDTQGKLDGTGAIQTNIPVAYTPGQGYFSLGAFKGNHISEFGSELSNGSSILAAGFGRWPRVYVSAMSVSRVWHESKAVSAQVQVIDETPTRPALAFGVQDVLNKEHKDLNAMAYYGVATKSLDVAGNRIYATLGFGGGRFLTNPFAGISAPIGDMLNLAVEYDGFQMNEGIALRPGGRYGNITLLGAYNGHAGLMLGASVSLSGR